MPSEHEKFESQIEMMVSHSQEENVAPWQYRVLRKRRTMAVFLVILTKLLMCEVPPMWGLWRSA